MNDTKKFNCCFFHFHANLSILVSFCDLLGEAHLEDVSIRYNNPDSCVGNSGEWKVQEAYNEPPPECTGGITSRDNHNGNVKNGHP